MLKSCDWAALVKANVPTDANSFHQIGLSKLGDVFRIGLMLDGVTDELWKSVNLIGNAVENFPNMEGSDFVGMDISSAVSHFSFDALEILLFSFFSYLAKRDRSSLIETIHVTLVSILNFIQKSEVMPLFAYLIFSSFWMAFEYLTNSRSQSKNDLDLLFLFGLSSHVLFGPSLAFLYPSSVTTSKSSSLTPSSRVFPIADSEPSFLLSATFSNASTRWSALMNALSREPRGEREGRRGEEREERKGDGGERREWEIERGEEEEIERERAEEEMEGEFMDMDVQDDDVAVGGQVRAEDIESRVTMCSGGPVRVKVVENSAGIHVIFLFTLISKSKVCIVSECKNIELRFEFLYSLQTVSCPAHIRWWCHAQCNDLRCF